MAVGVIAPFGKWTGFDNDGHPAANGFLYTYVAGTTTALATYSDVGLTAANTNPVVLDASGRATVFFTAATAYKMVLANSLGTTLWTQDNVTVAAATGTVTKVLAGTGLTATSTGSETGTGDVTLTVSGVLTGDAVLPATKRVYLDGGDNTYISESTADVLSFTVGGSAILSVVKPVGDGYVSATGGYAMTTWPTVAGSANAILGDGAVIKMATSLRKYKTDIQAIPAAEGRRVIQALRPVTFRSLLPEDDRVWAGFIAEEVEAVEPTLCVYAPLGELQSVAYDRIPTYLLAATQDLLTRVAALEARTA